MLDPKSNGSGDFWQGRDETDSRKPARPPQIVVLAIDDDPGMLKFFEAALANKGVRVEGSRWLSQDHSAYPAGLEQPLQTRRATLNKSPDVVGTLARESHAAAEAVLQKTADEGNVVDDRGFRQATCFP